METELKKYIKIPKNMFKDMNYKIDVGITNNPDTCEICKARRNMIIEDAAKKPELIGRGKQFGEWWAAKMEERLLKNK